MSEKLVLIDGHSILNRAFFGIPDLTNSEGLHTNAVYGFLNILFKILEEEQPNYLTVAFDVSQPTFRHKMYAEYKGTRKPMAEAIYKCRLSARCLRFGSSGIFCFLFFCAVSTGCHGKHHCCCHQHRKNSLFHS